MEESEKLHEEAVTTERPLGKQRGPVVVALLGFVTFGIYFIYWQYKVNKEMMAYDDNIKSNAALSALATGLGYFLGVLFYVGIVSAYKTCDRAVRMMDDYGARIEVEPPLGGALYALGGLGFPMLQFFYPPYLQDRLNAFWRRQEGLRAEVSEQEERAA